MHQQAGHALQREAQGLHTWHEKLLNAHIACRASADAAPLSGRNSLCADGTWRASIWHEHVGCDVVVRCNGSRQHFELALPVTVCCASCPTSCFGVAVMSESEYMQKVPQEKLLLVIRATFFPKSAKQPNVTPVLLLAHSSLRQEATQRAAQTTAVERSRLRAQSSGHGTRSFCVPVGMS